MASFGFLTWSAKQRVRENTSDGPGLSALASSLPKYGSRNHHREHVMADDQNRKTAMTHAEGGHGDKTHASFIDSLHGKHEGSEEYEGGPASGCSYGD